MTLPFSIEGAGASRVRRIAHLDLPGSGQVCVSGGHCYLGHHTSAGGRMGTTILDVRDPRNPREVAFVANDDPESHSHKVRVAGDVMIVNVEQNGSRFSRKTEDYLEVRAKLLARLGREPTHAELGEGLGLPAEDIPALLEARERTYGGGGFKVYDVSNPAAPKFLHYQKTGKKGVHRFDMDETYAYISTEIEGYQGNILVIYDITRPDRPQEVSRWWMRGQHVAGGEVPTWAGRKNRLHHALRFGDQLWASVWHAGMRVIDISDISSPQTVGAYNYHPPFPATTHTVIPSPTRLDGMQVAVAVDEEEAYYNPVDAARRKGQPHACVTVYDASRIDNIRPLSIFQVSELDSPFSQVPRSRFGSHQFHERMIGSLVFCVWFSGGLRIVDLADPRLPREVGWFIPEPVGGEVAPQSNDVFVDERGLIHVVDRNAGYDILEFAG